MSIFPSRSLKALSAAVAVGVMLLGMLPSQGRATPVQFTFAGSDGDGRLSALVTFTPHNGFIDVKVANTENSSGLSKGQAITALNFTVGNGLSIPALGAFTNLVGNFAHDKYHGGNLGGGSNLATVTTTAFNDANNSSRPPYAIDHWGFGLTGNAVVLAAAGGPVPGAGHPRWMIIPNFGTAGPAGSLIGHGNFDPFIVGPADFLINVTGVTSSTDLTRAGAITGLQLGFGTGPDTFLAPNPEPSSLVLFGGCVLGLVGFAWRRGGLAAA